MISVLSIQISGIFELHIQVQCKLAASQTIEYSYCDRLTIPFKSHSTAPAEGVPLPFNHPSTSNLHQSLDYTTTNNQSDTAAATSFLLQG